MRRHTRGTPHACRDECARVATSARPNYDRISPRPPHLSHVERVLELRDQRERVVELALLLLRVTLEGLDLHARVAVAIAGTTVCRRVRGSARLASLPPQCTSGRMSHGMVYNATFEHVRERARALSVGGAIIA